MYKRSIDLYSDGTGRGAGAVGDTGESAGVIDGTRESAGADDVIGKGVRADDVTDESVGVGGGAGDVAPPVNSILKLDPVQ